MTDPDALLALLREVDDLVPRISEDEPMAAALADWLHRARAAIAENEAAPERKPELPRECRHCDWLDKYGPLVPQGRPFCEQFRFCPPVEQHRHFGCTKWQPRGGKDD